MIMGFKELGTKLDIETVKEEFKNGEKEGPVVLGETCFIFKAGFSKYYIPYYTNWLCKHYIFIKIFKIDITFTIIIYVYFTRNS